MHAKKCLLVVRDFILALSRIHLQINVLKQQVAARLSLHAWDVDAGGLERVERRLPLRLLLRSLRGVEEDLRNLHRESPHFCRGSEAHESVVVVGVLKRALRTELLHATQQADVV